MNSRERRKTESPNPNWLRPAIFVSVVAMAFFASAGLVIAHVEDNSAFCASCHTQPESAYYQRAIATTSVDLASKHAAKNITCIECHSGPGVTGRIGGMMVGAGDLLVYESGHYRNPAVVTVAIADGNCLKCHATVTAKRDFNNHFHVFLAKWQSLDPKNAATCVECHQSHITDGVAKVAFLKEAPTVAVCQRCHAFAGAH
ncbi:MAG: hypothetical protein HY023_19365 [Chloroflexi bacterium]|nr:hypothetical protein [Chloroflexota bacterium]